MRILFLTVYETSGLISMKNYVASYTDSMLDFMIFGLPKIQNGKISQHFYFVDATGKKRETTITIRRTLREPWYSLFKFVTHWYALWMFFRFTRGVTYDVCIAETPTLAVFSWMLKKLKICRMGVFHVIDVYAEPPANRIDGFLIHGQKILRHIAYRNDLIWYTQRSLKQWDVKRGFIPRRSFLGMESLDSRIVPKYLHAARRMTQLCYLGRMDESSGLDIAIQSIALIRKNIPDIILNIIGGYTEETIEHYKRLARQEGVADRITFQGYIEDSDQVKKILASSALGLALYRRDIHTFPGKVLDYLQTGTPVVITHQGPEFKNIINRYGAGIVVHANAQDAAENTMRVLTDSDAYRRLQSGVLRLTKELDHRRIQSYIHRRMRMEYKKMTQLAL